jgi:hypothetical protein
MTGRGTREQFGGMVKFYVSIKVMDTRTDAFVKTELYP